MLYFFQVLNMNSKTGNLVMEIQGETGEIDFCEGRMIKAGYKSLSGQEAFFELLKARKGRFKFTPKPLPQNVPTDDLGDFIFFLLGYVRVVDDGVHAGGHAMGEPDLIVVDRIHPDCHQN